MDAAPPRDPAPLKVTPPRCSTRSGSMASAIQFLNSDNFRYAVSQGWLTLVIQIFAARAGAELLGEGNWEEDDEVPDLGSYSPPRGVGEAGHS